MARGELLRLHERQGCKGFPSTRKYANLMIEAGLSPTENRVTTQLRTCGWHEFDVFGGDAVFVYCFNQWRTFRDNTSNVHAIALD
eukprot:8266252-Pyramimonas_sp.AAC.1